MYAHITNQSILFLHLTVKRHNNKHIVVSSSWPDVMDRAVFQCDSVLAPPRSAALAPAAAPSEVAPQLWHRDGGAGTTRTLRQEGQDE